MTWPDWQGSIDPRLCCASSYLTSFRFSLGWRWLKVCLVVVAAWIAVPAWASDPFRIRDIRVVGLQRTDPGTVFAALPFRIDDTYSEEKGSVAVRALFSTGLFKDVRLEIVEDVVVVVLEERSIVSAVTFIGLKEFEKDMLVRVLKDVGIGEGMPFDRAVIDRAEQEIKRQYLAKSFYGAEVTTTVTPLDRNRVNVTFTMNEGDVAKIREIVIQGAQTFPGDRLLDLFDLRVGGWLSWYTKADRYSRSRLNGDLEKLRAFYLNRGFLEFSIESTQVTISPDKQDIRIAITIREGQPYVVTAIRLEGELLGKGDDIRSLVAIRPGQPYNGEEVTASVRSIVELFGRLGYAFARVEPRTDVDRANGRVEVVLFADPRRRVYVRRIEISGNDRTRDEVIRREFRQLEASWYDAAKIKMSRDRVDRLGYFKEVEVSTLEVPETPDQVDLQVRVEERPTGNLMLGAGYSSAEKLTISASIRQDNFLGSGNYLGIELNTSTTNRTVSFSTVDPYFTEDGISRSIDVYYRTTRLLNSLSNSYQLATPGAAIRFGIPYSDVDTVFFGLGVERMEVLSTVSLPNSYFIHVQKYGRTSDSMPFSVGWQRDERDSSISPTKGRYQRFNFEWSPVGDIHYVKSNGQFQQYWPVSDRVTAALNLQVGWGRGLSGSSYPVFKNFYGGGLGSVRGFAQGSLGAIDPTGAFIGGSKRLDLNTEILIPVPGSGNDRSLRVFAFADAGNVWTDGDSVDLATLRSSMGVGLSWISPVGPLKMNWGKPIRSFPRDRIQQFNFQIGTAF